MIDSFLVKRNPFSRGGVTIASPNRTSSKQFIQYPFLLNVGVDGFQNAKNASQRNSNNQSQILSPQPHNLNTKSHKKNISFDLIFNQASSPSASFCQNVDNTTSQLSRLGDEATATDEQMLNYVKDQENMILKQMNKSRSKFSNQLDQRFKYLQFNKLQHIKANLETSMLENQVQETIQILKSDQQIKVNESNDFNPNKGIFSCASEYTLNDGFVLRWDWMQCLPITYQRMKIKFGIFRKNEDFIGMQETRLFQTEKETYSSNKCIFLEKQYLREVKPFHDTVIYCEFSGYVYTSDGVPVKPQAIGWSIHQLFSRDGQIISGKFKLPFYSSNYDPKEFFTERLPYLSNCALFIRVCLPNDHKFDADSILMLKNDYPVQSIHLGNKSMWIQEETTNILRKHLEDSSYQIADLPFTQNQRTLKRIGSQFTSFSQFGRQEPRPQIIVEPNLKGKTLGSKGLPKGGNSTAIESNSKEEEKMVRIKLNKLTSMKMEVKNVSIRLSIFQKNAVLQTINKTPASEETKLEGVKLNKTTAELPLNFQSNQSIDWKDILQKNTKRDLEKFIFYCAIFNSVVGKEDELIAWIAWPLYKVDNASKNINAGVFDTNLFKKPTQKPPFGEKKEKSEISLNFEIEAIGFEPTVQQPDKPKSSDKKIAGTTTQVPEEEDDQVQVTSQKFIKGKYIEDPNDNNRKLVIDFIGIEKYTVNKDLQYKVEIMKEGVPIQDENGHKCVDKKNINIIQKGKDRWQFDTEQRFELGQVTLASYFKEETYSKGIMIITIMIKDKTEVIGIAKVPIFKEKSSELTQGRNKMELVKIEKDGTEKPVKFMLDYQIKYLNHKQMQLKQYDPNKGLRVFLSEFSNYREKWFVSYSVTFMIGGKIVENSQGIKDSKFQGKDFVACVVKEKKIPFKDPAFLFYNIEKIQDQYRRQLDEIFLLFEFIFDKTEEKGGQGGEVPYAWFVHKLFSDQGALISGKFNEQIYQLPKPSDFPADPKKMKKLLVKFEYEIGEGIYKVEPKPEAANNKQDTPAKVEIGDENKFCILVDQLTSVSFSGEINAKISIILMDDVFPTDKGSPCQYTGAPVSVEEDTLTLNGEYNVDIYIEGMKKKYPKQLDQFFLFINFLDSQQKSVMWFISKIFEKGNLRVGKFSENCFEPPVPSKLSTALKAGKKSTAILNYELKKGYSDLLPDS